MKILKFSPSKEKGYLIGFFDLYVDEQGYDLIGCSLFIKGDQRWINTPSKEYKNEEGETKYAPTWKRHEEESQKKFKSLALDCVINYCHENQIQLS